MNTNFHRLFESKGFYEPGFFESISMFQKYLLCSLRSKDLPGARISTEGKFKLIIRTTGHSLEIYERNRRAFECINIHYGSAPWDVGKVQLELVDFMEFRNNLELQTKADELNSIFKNYAWWSVEAEEQLKNAKDNSHCLSLVAECASKMSKAIEEANQLRDLYIQKMSDLIGKVGMRKAQEMVSSAQISINMPTRMDYLAKEFREKVLFPPSAEQPASAA
jgi:hypothetical protein